MIERRCPHCESEIEVFEARRATCPVCGLDPDLPRLAFDDAPAYFFAGDPGALDPIPVADTASQGSAA